MDSKAPLNIGNQTKIAREHAILGHYDTSIVYYDGVISQISQYIHFRDATLK
jgi:hypothetical protein